MLPKESLLSRQANAIVENKDEIHDLRILLDDLNILGTQHNIQGATKMYGTLRNCVELYFNVLKSLSEERGKAD